MYTIYGVWVADNVFLKNSPHQILKTHNTIPFLYFCMHYYFLMKDEKCPFCGKVMDHDGKNYRCKECQAAVNFYP